MTDPRTAALAEALTEVQGGSLASWTGRAPLILAALDSQGFTVVAKSEIARLRRIEEAARAFHLAWIGGKSCEALHDEVSALRAALEEDR